MALTLVTSTPRPTPAPKEPEPVLSPKAEKLYKRMMRWPSYKFAKRYARVSVRERHERVGPQRLGRYLRKIKQLQRNWWRDHYKPKRYTFDMLQDLKKPLQGSEAWDLYHQVRTHTHLRSMLIAEGDYDTWAGNGVEDRVEYYRMYGQLVKLHTYPDWDNCQEDFTIYFNGKPVAIYEG